jgi:hypothetical protein
LAGAALDALSTAAVSAELVSAGDAPVPAGSFAGAAGGLLATEEVGTDLFAAGAGPAGLFVEVAVGLSATGDAELSAAAGSPIAAGFTGIGTGLLGVAAALVVAGAVVLGSG